MTKPDPYDPPEWLQNWAALHNLTIGEAAGDYGWDMYAADGTPHVSCHAGWGMEYFLGTLVVNPDYGILQHDNTWKASNTRR